MEYSNPNDNLKTLTVVQLDLVESSESTDVLESQLGPTNTQILINVIKKFVQDALDLVINPPNNNDLIISLGGDAFRLFFYNVDNAYQFVKEFRKIVEQHNKIFNRKKRSFRIAATTGEVDFDEFEPCANKIVGHNVLTPLSRLVTAESGWFYVDNSTYEILPKYVKPYFTEQLVKGKAHEDKIEAWRCKIIFDEQLHPQKVKMKRYDQKVDIKKQDYVYLVEDLSKAAEPSAEPSACLIKIEMVKIPEGSLVEPSASLIKIEMVKIPEETFKMGSPRNEQGRNDYENSQHRVDVKSFFLAKYPVTQEQWQFVAQLPQVNRELNQDPSYFKGANRPVESVSWDDADEFCLRLSQYTGRIYRLPSEAEWEYACRAGTTTPFHFRETITSKLANYDANYIYGAGVQGIYRKKTTPVGSFKVANAFELYDMHGNVWEWCLDNWHDNYKRAPIDGSPWLDDNNNLYDEEQDAVLRGGSWFNNPAICRSASRSYGKRNSCNNNIGFRIVCEVEKII